MVVAIWKFQKNPDLIRVGIFGRWWRTVDAVPAGVPSLIALVRAAEGLRGNQTGNFGAKSSDLRTALLSELQRQRILEEILEGEAAINPGLTRTMPKPPKAGNQNHKVA